MSKAESPILKQDNKFDVPIYPSSESHGMKPTCNVTTMASVTTTTSTSIAAATATPSEREPSSQPELEDNPDNGLNGNKLIFAPADGQYTLGKLDRSDLSDDPLIQFHTWFSQACSAKVFQPEATTLSTAHLPSGRVSARIVYLKELDRRGFVIYSNWVTSNKAKDISTNPWAALTFWFREQERQVRIEGITERLSREESKAYFNTRIRSSRIGAWASQQSAGLGSRQELEDKVKELEKIFEGKEEIDVPPYWGGLRIVPVMIEFWQGRHSRLHDRFRYERKSVEDKKWEVGRLSP